MNSRGQMGRDPDAGKYAAVDSGNEASDVNEALGDAARDEEQDEEQEESSSGLLIVAGVIAAAGGIWLAAKKGWL